MVCAGRSRLNFNHLKTTLGMDVLKKKSVENIRKELIAYCIIYNLVRLVMIEAARWLLESLFQPRPLNVIVVSRRPGRREPRVKKRREKPYPYMLRPRAKLKLFMENQQFIA